MLHIIIIKHFIYQSPFHMPRQVPSAAQGDPNQNKFTVKINSQ